MYKLHDELTEENPSAAGSLAEGLEETLTLLELGVTPRLRRSLSSTNGIESSFAMVQEICRQVKRWQGNDHRLRWWARRCCLPRVAGTGFVVIGTSRC